VHEVPQRSKEHQVERAPDFGSVSGSKFIRYIPSSTLLSSTLRPAIPEAYR
jgi:hypothetical protein